MRAATMMGALMLFGCQGPLAPDSAICRDYLHRICIKPVCPVVAPLFPSTQGCEETLRAKTGCDSEEFAFTTPSRDKFLSCRILVLGAGQDPQQRPSCEDVSESFDRCPDVVRLLQGTR